jgi:proteic killer suppression protein
MIKSFKHKGLKALYEQDSERGVRRDHAMKLRRLLLALDTAQEVQELNLPGFGLHPLKGQQKSRWSLWVNGNWRVTFEFRDGDAYILDYEDYH